MRARPAALADSHAGLWCLTWRSGRRMHEWLINHAAYADRGHFTKHVLQGFGHQDLFWGLEASAKVYPLIVAGLARYESTHAWFAARAAAQ